MTKPGPRPAAPTRRRNLALVWAAAALVLAAVVVFGAIRTAPSGSNVPGSDFLAGDFLTATHQQTPSPSATAAPAPAAVDLPAEIQRLSLIHI